MKTLNEAEDCISCNYVVAVYYGEDKPVLYRCLKGNPVGQRCDDYEYEPGSDVEELKYREFFND